MWGVNNLTAVIGALRQMVANGALLLSDTAQLIINTGGDIVPGQDPRADAFGRMRVSANNMLLDSKFNFDKWPLLWDEKLTAGGTATLSTDAACINLAVTAAAGDIAHRQTFEYFRYRAGQSQLIDATFVMGTAVAGIVKEIRYGDAENGIILQQNGLTTNLLIRSKASGVVVDNAVAQTSWNADVFDGTGSADNPSGILIDWTKAQIMVIDLQWLGVGAVRIGFNIDGMLYYAHEFRHANAVTDVYMSTASLPVGYYIENVSGAAGSNLRQICSSVTREGAEQNPSVQTEADNYGVVSTATTTLRSILTVRLKSTHIRGALIPTSFGVVTDTNASVHGELLLIRGSDIPAAISGGAWADCSGIGSASEFSTVQADLSGVTLYHPVAGSWIPAGNQDRQSGFAVDQTVSAHADIDGLPDYLVLSVQTPAGTSATTRAVVTFLEQF